MDCFVFMYGQFRPQPPCGGAAEHPWRGTIQGLQRRQPPDRSGQSADPCEVLREKGYAVEGLYSKSWDVFTVPAAPKMDLVITVCDNAAGEICPVWPGHPSRIHIGFPDPAATTGTPAERLAAFRAVYALIEATVRRLIALGPERMAEK